QELLVCGHLGVLDGIRGHARPATAVRRRAAVHPLQRARALLPPLPDQGHPPPGLLLPPRPLALLLGAPQPDADQRRRQDLRRAVHLHRVLLKVRPAQARAHRRHQARPPAPRGRALAVHICL
ncbi:hypothetical protein H4R21_005765, partial [Coemansia helicoidea]